jgi:UDP-N-acetylmuramoyl-L-alanyl-D-glutamate--2,6-diaminopimelate ligase
MDQRALDEALMKLTELLKPWITGILPNLDITGLCHDSRLVTEGCLFLAYPGSAFDGRVFIEEAVEKGARAVFYEENHLPATFILSNKVPCIGCDALAEKVAAIAARFYDDSSSHLNITGVTGTNGKTTIAFQLAKAYALLRKKSAYIGTLGQGPADTLEPLLNTTPDALCLQKLFREYSQNDIEYVAMEVSSHALYQGRVDEIHFNQAVFSNLTHDHLDYHQTMQAYAEAKALLFAYPALQCAIINYDDAYGELMRSSISSSCQTLTYGLKPDADVRAVEWHMDLSGTTIIVESPWGQLNLHVKSLGQFNVYNSLAVLTSLLANGIPVNSVISVMSELPAAPGRLEVVREKPLVVVDYAHTPDALENVLKTLKSLNHGRLWVVFGCGGDRDKTKRPKMGSIASRYAEQVIITSDNPRGEVPETIMEEIETGLESGIAYFKITNRREAIQYALKHALDEDIVLVAGKGHEEYQQIGQKRHHFSDKEEVMRVV